MKMAFGYRYTLERQDNGWWLVRFPGVPEALTEGENLEDARANAVDCVIAALEGYMREGKKLPRQGAGHTGRERAALPSLVTAKLIVYETMRARLVEAQAGKAAPHAGELGAAPARPAPQLADVGHRRGLGQDERREDPPSED
jgi:predicted RNase H-like HicB family nuclease